MKMKLLIPLLLTLLAPAVFAQPANNDHIPSNSFDSIYRKSNPLLKYSYNNKTQTHNYSDNWDFDKDGKMDQVYFIGTGGAHLYYFLKVVLSSDQKSREFNFIQSDFPLLTATDTLDFDKTPVGFVVTGFGPNLTPTIIVQMDEQSFHNNKELKRKNIRTRNILVSFENGITRFGWL